MQAPGLFAMPGMPGAEIWLQGNGGASDSSGQADRLNNVELVNIAYLPAGVVSIQVSSRMSMASCGIVLGAALQGCKPAGCRLSAARGTSSSAWTRCTWFFPITFTSSAQGPGLHCTLTLAGADVDPAPQLQPKPAHAMPVCDHGHHHT